MPSTRRAITSRVVPEAEAEATEAIALDVRIAISERRSAVA